MKYIYLYVKKEQKNDCLKYGIKLSEYADKIIDVINIQKRGIVAYLSPKDTDKYDLKEYTCLKIRIDDLNIFVYNRICENSNILNHQFTKIQDYEIGTFEDPSCLICSSILPENIYIYNKTVDSPLIVQDSKEYFYEKVIHDFVNNTNISKKEIYLKILDLAIKENILNSIEIDNENKLEIYINKNNEKYIKKLPIKF